MEHKESELVPFESPVPAELSPAEQYLARIRPEWQTTPLVSRVKRGYYP
jgi:hypothetical protein